MGLNSLVRWESAHTKGKYFIGRVMFTTQDRALVKSDGFYPVVIQLTRLEYIRPSSRFAGGAGA